MAKPAWIIYPCLFLVSVIAASTATKNPSEGENEEAVAVQSEKKEPVAEKKKSEKQEIDEKEKQDKKEAPGTPKKAYLRYQAADSELKFGIKLRMPEFFYGKNIRLLNDDNPTDRVLYFRHTIDFNTEYRYIRPVECPYDLIYVKMTVRNKGVWGDPESIATTTASTIKQLDAVFGDHKHAIPRHILWIRELWIQLSLNDIACIPFCNQHYLTFGAFPFELGRGIALGTAYAIDASDLGYYSENAIDQYAFGGKLSGDIIKDSLTYDLYAAILDNKASTFDYANLKIRGQQYGHRNDQARGFGIINYVTAARVRWFPSFQGGKAKARIEPYALYNHNPEQRIEFTSDAKSDLFTMGLAAEFEFGSFEAGFDTAFNFGKQTVFGWDRNIIRLDNRAGTAVVVNSRVRQAPPGTKPDPDNSPLALKVTANQNIINLSPQAGSENGQEIGTNALGILINDSHRFSDPYFNKFRGSMFVYDMGYYLCNRELKLCAGFGYASGDANPNKDEQFRGDSEVDGVYEGFIGLQEIYSGTRIKSAFLMSGSGKVPRPLSFPSLQTLDPFATTTSRFTNLVFVGGSAYWKPTWSIKKWNFNPNVLAYWTDFSSPFFDARTLMNSVNRFARNFLGTELNIFVEAELLEDLRFFTVASIFLPGSHYRDIKGRPLTPGQSAYLDSVDRIGIINDRQPFLGDDKSYFLNWGFEYRF